MQRKLRLHENITCTALARHIRSGGCSILAVEEERGVPQPHIAMVVPRLEEDDTINTHFGIIKYAAGGQAPSALFRFNYRRLQYSAPIRHRLDRLVGRIGSACEGTGRQRRKQRHQRSHDLLVEIHRHGSHGQDQQETPYPNSTRSMQIEIQPCSSLSPAECKGFGPCTRPGKRDPQGNETIECPDNRESAHEQDAQLDSKPIRNMHAEMQLVQKRQQILATERNLAPHALAAHFPINWIEEYLIEI